MSTSVLWCSHILIHDDSITGREGPYGGVLTVEGPTEISADGSCYGDRRSKYERKHESLRTRVSDLPPAGPVCLALNRPGLSMVGSLSGHPLHNGCSSFPRTYPSMSLSAGRNWIPGLPNRDRAHLPVQGRGRFARARAWVTCRSIGTCGQR